VILLLDMSRSMTILLIVSTSPERVRNSVDTGPVQKPQMETLFYQYDTDILWYVSISQICLTLLERLSIGVISADPPHSLQ
jgi:hypothetical protein